MGEVVGQRGSSDRSGGALRAAEVRGSASAVGGGADLLLALSKPEDEQRLRAAARELRSVRLRRDEPLDGEAFGSLMRLSEKPGWAANGPLRDEKTALRGLPWALHSTKDSLSRALHRLFGQSLWALR